MVSKNSPRIILRICTTWSLCTSIVLWPHTSAALEQPILTCIQAAIEALAPSRISAHLRHDSSVNALSPAQKKALLQFPHELPTRLAISKMNDDLLDSGKYLSIVQKKPFMGLKEFELAADTKLFQVTNQNQYLKTTKKGAIEVIWVPERNATVGHIAIRIGDSIYDTAWTPGKLKSATIVKKIPYRNFINNHIYANSQVEGLLIKTSPRERESLRLALENQIAMGEFSYNVYLRNCATSVCEALGNSLLRTEPPAFGRYDPAITFSNLIQHKDRIIATVWHKEGATRSEGTERILKNPLNLILRVPFSLANNWKLRWASQKNAKRLVNTDLNALLTTLPNGGQTIADLTLAKLKFAKLGPKSSRSTLVLRDPDVEKQGFLLSLTSPGNSPAVVEKTRINYSVHIVDDHFDLDSVAFDKLFMARKKIDQVRELLGEDGIFIEHEITQAHKPSVTKNSFLRMLLGGLYARAPNAATRTLLAIEFKAMTLKKMDPKYHGILNKVEPEVLLLNHKTLLQFEEQFDSDFDFNLTEAWNSIFSPLLYRADHLQEIARGEYSTGYRIISDTELIGLIDAGEAILKESGKKVSGQRLLQLELGLKTYEDQVSPLLKARYSNLRVTLKTLNDASAAISPE